MTTSNCVSLTRIFGCFFLLTCFAFSCPLDLYGQDNSQELPKQAADDQSTKQDAQDPATDEADEGANSEFKKAELPPLKRIVMYNSGVGQMQHAGKVDGKQRMEIRFGNHDVNDVLKSIVFEDKSGGSVKAVEYQPAPEPEDVAANQIGQPMTLAQLLHRFRGESVELERGRIIYSGIIYGVENRARGDIVEETVILITDEGMEAVGLSDVTKTRFVNDELRKEMKLAMSGLTKSRKTNTQALELLLDGEGERDVQFAYVVDIPIWRMTYRLSLQDDKANLQGWAHIDNITGVDWKDVTIELRSGKPQAFHINIFDPLMAQRPELGNSVFDYTVGLTLIQKMFGGSFGDYGGDPSSGGFFGGGGFGGGLGGRGLDIDSAFRMRAGAGRASQMVTYKLDNPVSLGAGKSAALPVFANNVPVRQMSVYTDDRSQSAPVRALQITNQSDSPIVSGPISIVGDGDYVGDSKLGRLSVGESAELVYGVDRAVNVSKDLGDSKEKLIEARLDEYEVLLFSEEQSTIKFDVENKDTEKRDVIIHFYLDSVGLDRDDLEGYSDDEIKHWFNPAPEKIENNKLSYELKVEPQETATLSVVVSVPSKTKTTVLTLTREKLRDWEKDGVRVAENELAFFNEIVELTESIDNTRNEIAKLNASVSGYEKDQERVRSNLEVVLKNEEAAKIYLDKLNQLEKQIEDAKAKVSELNDKLEALKSEQMKKFEAIQQ